MAKNLILLLTQKKCEELDFLFSYKKLSRVIGSLFTEDVKKKSLSCRFFVSGNNGNKKLFRCAPL